MNRKGKYIDNFDGTVSIPLTQGKFALIDFDDLPIIKNYTWCYDNGYARTTIVKGGKQITLRMHRLIVKDYENKEIDHINGNRSDNRKINLRACFHSENLKNQTIRSTNKSGYKGVCWQKSKRKWRATIYVEKKQKHLGLFDCPNEAHKAYVKASDIYFGEFSNHG
ncbi:HNH endonuclease [Sphingobacterium lactis]|uniref:HNH endonuclease n=1 Tax=Sphingobacterium lactis TaxID=797291 RepID=A0A1H6CS34_9SPHI|nr:AP2 domain-containing protein [Sphingobacterium lactis]SEG75455.1 HNH endonuclease [Sphingobacterium lactis]